jgi:intron-binding protein aquarius
LGNLAHVENWAEYRVANSGFWFDFQLINVEDFNGVGESEPSPYFYQVSMRLVTCLVIIIAEHWVILDLCSFYVQQFG